MNWNWYEPELVAEPAGTGTGETGLKPEPVRTGTGTLRTEPNRVGARGSALKNVRAPVPPKERRSRTSVAGFGSSARGPHPRPPN